MSAFDKENLGVCATGCTVTTFARGSTLDRFSSLLKVAINSLAEINGGVLGRCWPVPWVNVEIPAENIKRMMAPSWMRSQAGAFSLHRTVFVVRYGIAWPMAMLTRDS